MLVIIAHQELEKIKDGYAKSRDFFKARAYAKAIASLSEWATAIRTEADAKEAGRLPGVGDSIVKVLTEVLKAGISSKGAKLELERDPRQDAIDDLCLVEGARPVGLVHASNLIDGEHPTQESGQRSPGTW